MSSEARLGGCLHSANWNNLNLLSTLHTTSYYVPGAVSLAAILVFIFLLRKPFLAPLMQPNIRGAMSEVQTTKMELQTLDAKRVR